MFVSRKLLASLVAVAICAVALVVPRSTASPGAARADIASTSTSTSTVANQGTYTSRVIGTFGKAGTVRGHFVPLRSFVRGGQAFVQGNLTATLRRGNGALVGQATRHDLTLPVHARGAHTAAAAAAAAAPTCNILHLVLGPLDLNLLGLMVHLDRVVLDITAQGGPGNLLGNLLCAIAHLLDNPTPTLLDVFRLSSLLNRVIGLIT
jgi:hypothetical protein